MTNALLFLLLAAFWGGSFVAIKYAITTIDPISAALWRVLIGLVFVGIVVKVTGKSFRLPTRLLWRVWLIGLFAIGLPFAFLFWGEKSISAGLAGIINGSVPIWTFAIGVFTLRNLESFTFKKLGGLILGLIGVILIFSPLLKPGTDTSTSGRLWGTLAVLVMAISYAISAVTNRRLLTGEHKIDIVVAVFHQHLSSLVFLVVVCWIFSGGSSLLPLNVSLPSAAACVYMGIFSSGIAWLVFYNLIKKSGAVKATTVTYLVPIMAVILDFLFFKELPEAVEALGMFVVFTGIFLVQAEKKQAAI